MSPKNGINDRAVRPTTTNHVLLPALNRIPQLTNLRIQGNKMPNIVVIPERKAYNVPPLCPSIPKLRLKEAKTRERSFSKLERIFSRANNN